LESSFDYIFRVTVAPGGVKGKRRERLVIFASYVITDISMAHSFLPEAFAKHFDS
jgi:hypothetical protein